MKLLPVRAAGRAHLLLAALFLAVAGTLVAQDGPPRKGAPPAPPPQQAPGAASGAAPGASGDRKKQPRAHSQDEADAFQKLMNEQNPDAQIKLIEDFLLAYPNTELKEYSYQAATQAYQAKNDYNKVLTYGELTLNENENNLVALLVLASAIPERTAKNDIDKGSKLTQAEQYAKRGLEVLSKLTMPANLTEEQWTQARKDAESTPHAALGMIALIREDFPKAEAEFQTATDLTSRPDPVTFYRLGLCYSFEKKYEPALQALEKAASSGGVHVAAADGSTRDLVAEAKDYVVKAKGATDTPVSGTLPPVAAPGNARP